jgi:RNA polymerase sigma factor (sigma-70 family)
MPPPAEGLASRLFLGPALRTQPDRRLVTLVREGYEAAFEEIVRRYGRPLGRYAASIAGGRSEDVLQDAFAKALPALQRDDTEIDLRPWLFRIVRNTALNDLRDSPPSADFLAETLAGGKNPADELEQREELTDLMRRLRALPEPQRAAIVMRELEGLGHEEIAAALGLTGGGARQAIYRARQALRNGAGLLLPLPLVRLLIDHGGEAAGAGTGGAIVAAGASAGGAGAGGALKLGVVAAVLAGSVGAGVAVHSHTHNDTAKARAVPALRSATAHASSPSSTRPGVAIVSGGVPRSDGRRQVPGRPGGQRVADNSAAIPPGEAEQVGRHLGDGHHPVRRPSDGRGTRNGHDGERHGPRPRNESGAHGDGHGPGAHGGHSGPRAGGEHRGEGPSRSEPGSSGGPGHGGAGPDRGSRLGGAGSGADDGAEQGAPPPPVQEVGSGDPEGSAGPGGSGSDSSHSGPGGGGRKSESP